MSKPKKLFNLVSKYNSDIELLKNDPDNKELITQVEKDKEDIINFVTTKKFKLFMMTYNL